MDYKTITRCRFCNSDKLSPLIDLGDMPLVNNLKDSPNDPDALYPLGVKICSNCNMGLTTTVVDPKVLYGKYSYRSGMSKTFIQHCKKLADELEEVCDYGSVVVDIAGNDGTLLSQFDKRKFKCINVEPSNLAEVSRDKGITTLNEFFDSGSVAFINREFGGADVITAQNVFTHIDCVNSFMCNVNSVLKDNGVLIIEVPWFTQILTKREFDLFYHEHLSYITLRGMAAFVEKFGFTITKIKNFSQLHGHTLRFYVQRVKDLKFIDTDSLMGSFIEDAYEDPYDTTPHYFAGDVQDSKLKLINMLKSYPEGVCALGASAKGCILVNFFQIQDYISKIYDTTPDKIGKFQPGTNLPIVSFDEVKNETKPMLILAWNWADEIIKKVRAVNPQARFIVPLPNLYEDGAPQPDVKGDC